MSGFPRWIRQTPDSPADSNAIAALAASLGLGAPRPAGLVERESASEPAMTPACAVGASGGGVRGSAEQRASTPLLGRLVAFYAHRHSD